MNSVRLSIGTLLLLCFCSSTFAQTTGMSSRIVPPPKNRYLADSAWPIYHLNNYNQAATLLHGLRANDRLQVQSIQTDAGGPSCWTITGEVYRDGSIPLWGGTTTHVTKVLVKGERFELIDKQRIDYDFLNMHWNCMMVTGNRFLTVDPKNRLFLVYEDTQRGCPDSPIRRVGSFGIPKEMPGKIYNLSMSYDGHIIFITSEGWIGALDRNMNCVARLDLSQANDDLNGHNAFPIDQYGGVYLVTDKTMTKVKWSGKIFTIEWSVPYDFRGSKAQPWKGKGVEAVRVLTGQEGTGSGTTPTLIGTGGMDKLVVVIDGHTPNNMVAFWRHEIPSDWCGLLGHNRRVAAVTPLPYSTPKGKGFSAENSPCAWGYEVFSAQWNGIFPVVGPVKGCQKLRWDSSQRKLDVAWSRADININNVPTFSVPTGLVYGSGREGSEFFYYGLDWKTGETRVRVSMGRSNDVFDGGNQQTILPDRSIVFGSKAGIVRIRPIPK